MKITETPRDAMQGFGAFISTEKKVEFANALLRVGFDVLDIGSFLLDKKMPQFNDVQELLERIDLSSTETKLQVLVDNPEGAKLACANKKVSRVAFPFSISETFAGINTNTNIDALWKRLIQVVEITAAAQKEFVVYISCAFGNPYGEKWSVDLVAEWVAKIEDLGVKLVQLADTTGEASPSTIELLVKNINSTFPNMEIGVHLHTEPHLYIEKVDAAFRSGCERFDTVLNGLGGCTTGESSLIGNLRTGSLISYIERNGVLLNINRMAFLDAVKLSKSVYEPATVV